MPDLVRANLYKGMFVQRLRILNTFTIILLLSACTSVQFPITAKFQNRSRFVASTIPLEDFFKNPLQTAFDISPDATFISFLAPYNGRMNIFIEPKDRSSSPIRITSVTDRNISKYFWKGPNTIIYRKDFDGDENYQFFAVNIKTRHVLALTPFPGTRADLIHDLNGIDKDHILIDSNKRDPNFFDAYRLNIWNGNLTEVAKNPGDVSEWLVDLHGRVRAAVTTDGVNRGVIVRSGEKSKFRTLLKTDFRESVSPVLFTLDDKSLYAVSNRGRDRSAIVALDLETASEKVLFQHPVVDVEKLSYSRKHHVLWEARFQTERLDRHFFDPSMEKIFQNLKTQLPNMEIVIQGFDENERIVIVQAYSDVNKGSYYIYDANNHALSKLADVAPWLKPDQMSEMQSIEYKSRDGLLIHAYLTIPRALNPNELPVIIYPHGGPLKRDKWGFDEEVQFLVSLGYAVFQPNFRGSTGYGRKFWEASFKQWGKKMQDDLTDGVEWLKQQGIADPNRIAIYGGSYGGYAALSGLSFNPDLYACGISYVGISNLFTFMKSFPSYWKPYLERMYVQIGDPEKEAELLRAASPTFHVDQIRVPLFVAHGAKDPRVKITESNTIVEALRKRGISVEYMVKENEGHGFRNEENIFDFYRAVERFLKSHL
jgi:dienelactone hydrolase